tara:strand:- start:129 stop:320 length:192 start_codon:yes stop_codon:yes gene_type:complete
MVKISEIGKNKKQEPFYSNFDGRKINCQNFSSKLIAINKSKYEILFFILTFIAQQFITKLNNT